MNSIIEENYAMVRALLLIKKNHPRRRLGCWYWQFVKVIFGPLMRSTKLIRTNADIRDAVSCWRLTRYEAEARYGHISDWENSQVTDMSYLFYGGPFTGKTFTDDISSWNVSSVIFMQHMFENAYAFNGNLSAWDVSKVTNMACMFHGAYAFTGHGDISTWNVSNVTNMRSMFQEANAFTANISTWDTSKVVCKEDMFEDAPAAKMIYDTNNEKKRYNRSKMRNKEERQGDNGERKRINKSMFAGCIAM